MDTLKARVLAVDDIPANLVVLDAVLGDKYDVIRARSGPEAIATLERDANIDVILMDIQMPGMDGYEAAERIKKMPGREDIPLVFITAFHTEDPHIKRGYAVGGVDYFTKPYDPDILRLKVDVYAAFRHRAALLKVKERALHESEDVVRVGRKLASVLERLPVGVMIADAEGRLCQTSDEVPRILRSVRAVECGTHAEVVAWWMRSKAAREHGGSPLARSLETGESFHEEIAEAGCVDGARTIRESISPLRRDDGAIVGAAVVLQDLTEPKRFRADLEERITRLKSLG